MTPAERQALRVLPAAERRRIVRALARDLDPRISSARELPASPCFVVPAEFDTDQAEARAEVIEDAALRGAQRMLCALLGDEVGDAVWAQLLGRAGRPPAQRLRASVSRTTAKIRRTLFAP